jgi:alkanesulfonate monooxygenase SsuD/methylene tetrahydromethanopterin reductase-like flavin-dependent oxidoreductase (luciferase family)
LAARYADVWNVSRQPLERLAELFRSLDARLAARGRPPTAVKRTIQGLVIPWQTQADLDSRTRFVRSAVNPQRLAPREFAEMRRARGDFIGSPESVADQLRAAANVGVQEVMIDTFELDDIEILEEIAGAVMPRL